MGKSSTKRSMRTQARALARAQMCAQGDGEIKYKKVNARALVRAQGDGEIKCKKVNVCTGAHTDARTG